MGIGLIASGIFTADAGAGFPAGAPAGAPDLSWHGILHEVGHLCVGIAWIAVCLVFRSRLAQQGERGWARVSVAVVPAAALLFAWCGSSRSMPMTWRPAWSSSP